MLAAMRACSTFQEQLAALTQRYTRVSKVRDERLYTVFLPSGYAVTTLSSVAPTCIRKAMLAKMRLGMLITLCDDYADRPDLYDPTLLREMYLSPFRRESIRRTHLNPAQRAALDLAVDLGEGMLAELATLPHVSALRELLAFDVQQFYGANHWAELVTRMPALTNTLEASRLLSHNMGMIAAGTIDLMASPGFKIQELGLIREVLHIGQRLGRIANVLTTDERERQEGDVTNEMPIRAAAFGVDIAVARQLLASEFIEGLKQLHAYESRIGSFSVVAYKSGLLQLRTLHEDMRGII